MKSMSRKTKISLILSSFMAVCTIVMFFSVFNSLSNYHDYETVIYSPDGSGKLIVQETEWLHGAECVIYYKPRYSLIKKRLGWGFVDGFAYPFRDGNYDVTWNDGSVTVRYYGNNSYELPGEMNTWSRCTYRLP